MRGNISIGILLVGLLAAGVGLTAGGQSGDTDTTGAPARADRPDDRVDLNSADRGVLETLPGVGPRTAQLIVEYREEHGQFEKVEELMNVRGIGERTFLQLRELVRVDADASR